MFDWGFGGTTATPAGHDPKTEQSFRADSEARNGANGRRPYAYMCNGSSE
jgi:hypothetical protein